VPLQDLPNTERAPSPPSSAQEQEEFLPVTRNRQILILISSFLTICITIGFNQSYGVFQSYYNSPEQDMLSDSTTDQSALIAFVGTLGAGLTWGGSIAVNPMMARVKDVRYLTVAGVLFMSLGFGLASLSTRIWHLLLTQGLLYGIGSSLLYFPILSVTPEYFNSHRGLAMGFVLSGSGVGGLVLSPLIRLLLSSWSARWTLRFLCFFNLLISMPIALTAPPSRFRTRRQTHVDVSLARKPAFLFASAAAFFQAAGNLLPLTFLVEYSLVLGYSSSFGAVLLALNNGVNSCFRVLTGFAGDRFGRQNALICTVIASALSVVAFWLTSVDNGYATSKAQVLWILFVVFYGVAGGGYNALFPTTVVDVFGLQAYASVNGFMYFLRGMGAMFGSPVGGKILGESVLGNYRRVVLFDAALLSGAAFCVVAVRGFEAVEKKSWRWKA
jgi:MFS family permease